MKINHQSIASAGVLDAVLAVATHYQLNTSREHLRVAAQWSSSQNTLELMHQTALQAGLSYKQVADATGLTESRVRQIESEWRKQQMLLRQGQLQLDD